MRFFGASALVPIVVAAVWSSVSAESSVLPPSAPSPLPADKIGRLGIACPADHQTLLLDGRPVTVHFGAPVVSGGQQPVSVGCSPHCGSAFDIGSTMVTRGAPDALQQVVSCAFRVTILRPPKLASTRILAFGDSLTAGVVSPHAGPWRLDHANAYPARLQRGLASRYVTQDCNVVNAGRSGEEASEAVGRFNSALRRHRPEVVLLMQGTNDLDVIAGAGADRAAAALDRSPSSAPDRGVLWSAAPRIPCIGSDGIHPTLEGYRLITEELERILVARYGVETRPAAEQPGETLATSLPTDQESVSHRRPR